MADSLYELIDHARREMPEIPDHAWKKFERIVRRNFGTTRLYIAAQRKRSHLEAIADADEQHGLDDLAEKLGIGVRRVQQLKKLL